MKTTKLILAILMMLMTAQCSWAVNASDVAYIDLSMALCLHPKMSLFDFNRIGFHRVEFGLTEDEFIEKCAQIRASAPNKANEIAEIEKELSDLYKERDGFSEYYVNMDEEKEKLLERKMAESYAKENELRAKMLDINHQAENFDLTSPKETMEIAAQIEKEIFDAINEVAAEKNYSVVLNASNPCPFVYKQNYIASGIYGQGIPSVNFMLFYSFLAKNNLDSPLDDTPPSRDVINWLESTRYPEAMNILPMKPYPLVLAGGHSILSDVVKKIYKKYNVDSAVYNVVDSVIMKIEQLQNGKQLEQKIQKFDF